MRLRASDLTVVRGGRRVLARVEFAVEPGVTATLRGPNGSGKTTLLRALAGLVKPERGEVWAADASSVVDIDLFQERIGFVGHLEAAKPAMTPLETLQFWGAFYGVSAFELEAKVAEALARFELGEKAQEPVGRLSAGQRRRLSLARLLLIHRPIWLLDEPTAALDANAQQILGDVLQQHAAEGGVTVMAIHGPAPTREDQVLDVSAFRPRPEDIAEDPFLADFDADPSDDAQAEPAAGATRIEPEMSERMR